MSKIPLARRCAVLFMGLAVGLLGCAEDAADIPVEQVMYRCEETGELIQAPPQIVPAPHPETGTPTLYRALYCPKCQKWQVVPPPDVFNGAPEAYPCPIHKTPMQTTGPLPAD